MLLRAALALAALTSLATAQIPTISSTFDADAEGWTVVHYESSGYGLPTYGPPATFDPGFGNPAGSLRVTDQMFHTGVAAPAAYLGDRRAWYGGNFSFHRYLRYTSGTSNMSCTLVGAAGMLVVKEPIPPKDQWLGFNYALAPGVWHWNDQSGALATQQQVLEVLADLQAICIVTEFAVGPDETSIDNVALSPPPSGSVAIFGPDSTPAGSVILTSGTPKIGSFLTLGLTNPLGTMSSGSPTFLAVSTAPAPGFPDGLALPGFGMAGPGSSGALLIDLAPGSLPVPVLAGPPYTGPAQHAYYTLTFPTDPAFAGLTVYAQGLILDPVPSAWFGLTQGLMITLGT